MNSATDGAAFQRAMAASFALGAACFLVGPAPGYVDLVGATADAITFFVGSVFFTIGGALQTWQAAARRHRADEVVAVLQSAGTLFFNLSTFRAMQTVLADSNYDRLVWRPT
ncbi:hypothetical protein [Cryptosporangium aurantiacum]|uniref:YrhK-like protein n=1 Tax=Cryptosporangium aurantiacum TaxID=134849 RepID=A0A1M7QYL3_9ACTN|nr:hypothetical protein [Cryptosporangium aurantiacum]SHN36960.1 hypothetical protein SAMN05443668_105596 [Cryptosporangium aurantiacum]